MEDRFDFASPLGYLGRVADALVLRRYMEGFLRKRAEMIREEAERRSGDWLTARTPGEAQKDFGDEKQQKGGPLQLANTS